MHCLDVQGKSDPTADSSCAPAGTRRETQEGPQRTEAKSRSPIMHDHREKDSALTGTRTQLSTCRKGKAYGLDWSANELPATGMVAQVRRAQNLPSEPGASDPHEDWPI